MTRLILICLSFVIVSGCSTQDLALHRLNRMKAAAYFDTQPQIDLADAITKSDTNKMQVLIAGGADVNYLGSEGMRPLFWALAKQNITAFRFLLNNGADPNVVAVREQSSAESALTLAAIMDNSEYLQELLAHGANPNLPIASWRETAIYNAILNERTNNISILLKNGADIDWKDASGTTPLDHAIGMTSFRMALFLYRAGANPLIKNNSGSSPIDTLKKFKDWGVQTSTDEAAYKELIGELIKRGLLDKAP
jgi:uncharacterized protein